jgi:hypothetical protein
MIKFLLARVDSFFEALTGFRKSVLLVFTPEEQKEEFYGDIILIPSGV